MIIILYHALHFLSIAFAIEQSAPKPIDPGRQKRYTVGMKMFSSQVAATRRTHIASLCYAAASVALLTVSSWVSVPVLTVPFTLQTFALFFIIGVLGTKWSFAAVLAYLLLGVAGVLVFSNFGSGIGTLAGVTGGYIVGFLLVCLVSGPLYARAKNNMIWQFAAMLAGLVVCYTTGTIWFAVVAGSFSWQGIGSALLTCVVPYIAVDTVKILLALFALRRLKPILLRLSMRT